MDPPDYAPSDDPPGISPDESTDGTATAETGPSIYVARRILYYKASDPPTPERIIADSGAAGGGAILEVLNYDGEALRNPGKYIVYVQAADKPVYPWVLVIIVIEP
jgi:hypothetical protein